MFNYIRQIVSGGKARFKDKELDLDLDLVYVTDQLIIMGFPAEGIEAFYRNKREDAKKFLDSRHGSNYWIFNLCPLTENSYDAAIFGGRVSRYPFPDHHAPPLAILALSAREIRLWLEASPDRVAVLHCKAGKGRSGTVACAYLSSLDISPEPPRLQRSYTAKAWAKLRAEQLMDAVKTDDIPDGGAKPDIRGGNDVSPRLADPTVVNSSARDENATTTGLALEKVLALHTARRMKPPSPSYWSPNSVPKKPKQGVSIPSQRRFLLYWSQLLSKTAPSQIWPLVPLAPSERPKVKLKQITVRLRKGNGAKMTLVAFVNTLLDKAAQRRRSYAYGHADFTLGGTDLWVSLARYDDDFVELLENWERRTRNEDGHLGKRHTKSPEFDSDAKGVMHIFDDGLWDKGKMVRSFAQLGRTDEEPDMKGNDEVSTNVLKPLNGSQWTLVQKSIIENPAPSLLGVPQGTRAQNDDVSFDDGTKNHTHTGIQDGAILEAAREVRVKLYLGQILMGWFWFIPLFHMSDAPTTHFRLSRNDVDFPLGAGAWIIDLDVEMEWVVPSRKNVLSPSILARRHSNEGGGKPTLECLSTGEDQVKSGEDVEIIPAVQAMT